MLETQKMQSTKPQRQEEGESQREYHRGKPTRDALYELHRDHLQNKVMARL